MKKKIQVFVGVLLLCLFAAGCGDKKTDTEQPKPDTKNEQTAVSEKTDKDKNLVNMEKVDAKEEPKSKYVFGDESEDASKLKIINKTGDEISRIYVRQTTDNDEEWGLELVLGKFVLKNGEDAVYCYKEDAKVSLYDIRIAFTDEDKSEYFFRKIPVPSIDMITLCVDGSGDEGIPYARYTKKGAGSKEYSTLEDVKKRLGLLDDYEQEDSEENEDKENEDEGSQNDDADGESPEQPGEEQPNPTQTPSAGESPNQPVVDPQVGISAAEGCIGKPLSALLDACGEPNGTTYENEPETGETGYHYYDGFTVSTTVNENGDEIVAGVW